MPFPRPTAALGLADSRWLDKYACLLGLDIVVACDRRHGTHRGRLHLPLVAAVIALLGFGTASARSQFIRSVLPDAPLPISPSVHAGIMARPVPSVRMERRQVSLYRASLGVLVAGEALDSWSTYRNLTHPKWICGYSPALGNASTYISDDGKHYDAKTVQNVLCGPSPSGQLANYAYDVTRTGAFTETGWVAQYGLARNRNYAAVELWNIGDDVAQYFLARYLSRRRTRIPRFVGPVIILSRGIVHFEEGILNVRFLQENNNPTAWRFRVPNEADLYPAPRWWGKQ